MNKPILMDESDIAAELKRQKEINSELVRVLERVQMCFWPSSPIHKEIKSALAKAKP